MNRSRKNYTAHAAAIGAAVIALILALGTLWMGQNAKEDTEEAVRSVSLFYLDELAGRREQVVEGNLRNKIRDMQAAISLIDAVDLSDEEHFQAYQARMRQLYSVEKFAFVDEDGIIHTADGTQDNIADYAFDYRTISGPEISVLSLRSADRRVVIAMPANFSFKGKEILAGFMEISMQEMLAGVSMQSQREGTTYSNIYTGDGIALSNTVLGGLAVEDNLLEAMKNARFEGDYSYERFVEDFRSGARGEVSFVYNGIRETLSFVPITGTDWQLTYLIRESVIGDRISSITRGLITRSIAQSLLTVAVLLVLFGFILRQIRKNTDLQLENERQEAESRVKQEEMEHRLALQEKLLEEEKLRTQQDQMITAMAADYRSVYHVDLDGDDAVCYRRDPGNPGHHAVGEHFPYLEGMRSYAEDHVTESYRQGFLRFIDPDNIRDGLRKEDILAYRYLAVRGGKEYYEMIRLAGVRSAEERKDDRIRAVGIGFTVIDAEMRRAMDQQQALSDALAAAEQANRAKTAFLSSMSHEIRTPMNAIIGLDNIALNDPETPEKTKEYLKKIGQSADHLLGLINDILDMSRIESGRMVLRQEEFSFPKLLEAVNTMFSSQCQDKGLDYASYVKGEVGSYYIGDNMKLRQVLINILGNAVKFTPEGGRVEFDVERTASYEGKDTLRFVIRDTGIGMSEEFLPRIFDSFAQEDSSTTSRYGSSGLGMAITKNIVEMMNGTIEVESTKGKGSVFRVTVTLEKSGRDDGGADEEEIRPEEMKVLVIDDDPVALEHAKLVLEKAGIESETASSGAEAIEMVKLRHARRTPYNLILVDWKMPEMDGVVTTRRIREITGRESAIIILTAYRWDEVFEEATMAGVDSFIPKPLFAGAVLEEYRTAAGRRKAGGDGGQKAELRGRRVLLAEDVEINAEIMKMVLESRGIEADLAENGKIAVDRFSSNPEGYYDAILMDMRMPEMDGLEATRVIRAMEREDAKRIPIIALTANAFDEDVQRSLQAGLNAHLSKPVEPEALFSTLESLIGAQCRDRRK